MFSHISDDSWGIAEPPAHYPFKIAYLVPTGSQAIPDQQQPIPNCLRSCLHDEASLIISACSYVIASRQNTAKRPPQEIPRR